MVGPYDEGRLTRSLVRVPGSGTDKDANTVICDLSRISTAAAAVPVSRTVPAALLSWAQEQETLSTENTTHIETLSGKSLKDVKNEEPLSVETVLQELPRSTSVRRKRQRTPRQQGSSNRCALNSKADKRARKVNSPQVNTTNDKYIFSQGVTANASPLTAVGTAGAPLVLLQGATVIPSGTAVILKSSSLNLLKERDQLRRQNEGLQQRISLFQQLFRDKERLTSVLKTLGINVQ